MTTLDVQVDTASRRTARMTRRKNDARLLEGGPAGIDATEYHCEYAPIRILISSAHLRHAYLIDERYSSNLGVLILNGITN